MNRIVRTARALALASLVALIATALAQGMMHGPGQAPGGATQPGVGVGPMGMGFALQTQTVDEASFLVHMIPHHREAVASAEALRAVTQRPELLELVDAIVSSQTAEITAMEGWLDTWYPDVDRDVAFMPMMRELGAGADVADVERAFLEDMIGHHMMAVHEAQTLLAGGLAEHPEVAELARSIVFDQMSEMQQMAAWLGSWYGVNAASGMGGYGMMGGSGMGGYGMAPDGFHGHGAGGPIGEWHEGMHGVRTGTTVGSAEAARLALAFLAGRGEAVDGTAILGTTVAYEVVVRVGDVEQVLRIDAQTGEVTLAPER